MASEKNQKPRGDQRRSRRCHLPHGLRRLLFPFSSFFLSACVGIIKLVAFVAGAWDLSFDVYAYAVVFMANICTASIVHIGKSSGLNTFGLMWCNGIICGPILLFLTSIRGDLQVTLNFPHIFSSGFQAVMVLSCIMAFSINYCVFFYYNSQFSSHSDNLCLSKRENQRPLPCPPLDGQIASRLNFWFCALMVICEHSPWACKLLGLLTIGLGWLLFGGLRFDLLSMKCY